MGEESLESSEGKVTRATLAQVIGDRIGLSNSLCNDLVLSFFDTIKQSLIAGDTVKIQKFATFNLRSKRARPGRNPKTGEEVEVSARRVVTFKPSRKLRNLVDTRGRESES
ncbi:MAG: integration host factor subunit alpha [Gammaproteobacteria bacterium]|nr:integration host factor subunit alpha [Gammaproteobacteria bacterium]